MGQLAQPQLQFWKYPELSEEQMFAEAQTGDLLIFRGNQTSSQFVRSATRGHFDHIAIIVRTYDEGTTDFSIVEAVGNFGVSSTTWNKIRNEIGVDKFYEKCTYRKLLGVKRNKKWLRLFDDFLEEAWEHDYDVNLAKLTAKGS